MSIERAKVGRFLRLALANNVVYGTLLVLLFSGGITFVFFYLSWLGHRDNYGITFVEYVRLFFF